MTYKEPVIKVTWEDIPQNFTPERIKRIKTYFQTKYGTKNVKILTKTLVDDGSMTLKSMEVTDNISDYGYQKKLIADYLKEVESNIDPLKIDRLDNKVNEEIDRLNVNKIKHNKWYIKKINFSNFLSFGQNNEIDFEGLEGITTIESNPKNFGGKSTVSIDLFLFLFFGKTTKTKLNIDIFNKFTDEDRVYVRGEILIDGVDYIIERSIDRKLSRSGEYKVTNTLNYVKQNPDGSVENLEGEQRRETEKFITSAIGTEEDFLSTILSTGNNLEELIDSKPTSRGQTLTKFLGLENLKIKEEVAKSMHNEWSKNLVSNTNNKVQLTIDIEKYQLSISESNIEIERLKQELETSEKEVKKLGDEKDELIGKKSNDVDMELVRINPETLLKEINELKSKQSVSQKQFESIDVTEPSTYYVEEEHDKVKSQIADANFVIRLNQDSINRNSKLVEQMEKGEICPTCNRRLDEVDHTDEIENLKGLAKQYESEKIKASKVLLDLNEKETSFSKIKKEYDVYENNKLVKAKYELDVEQKQLQIDSKQIKLNQYESNKSKLELNTQIDANLIILKTKIDSLNGYIRQIDGNISKNANNITNLNEKIEGNKKLINKITVEEEYGNTFRLYLNIFGKNGISKIIMKNMIPLLNQELYRLLVDSCNFILELNVNDRNEVEFIMIDTESRVIKLLESGSGYEKSIASFALRAVLTRVSSLPKPNVVVMDEVFGKVADENLEMVGEFFKKIKNYFDHILLISHNPLIRNWSDNIIMINKENNVSGISFITKNIS
jgi:DNA repair exonuclease SbcCD ATPase subunit